MEGRNLLPAAYFPPGFRFHPTDQELIIHYLRKKITSSLPPPSSSIIADVDLYKFNPWELPAKALFGEREWFFFSPRDRKYPNGVRPNRAAASGYWKATCTDKPILADGGAECLGVKKVLVFYKGRPPKGAKTDWIMQEYRLLDSTSPQFQKQNGSMRLDDWVLCRLRQRGSVLPENDEKPAPNMWSPSPVILTKANERKRQEGNKIFQLNDCQATSNLQPGSLEESAGESPDLSAGGDGVGHNGQELLFSSMVSSIKRELSFGALDEMILLLPNKRVQFSAGPPPPELDSDDEGYLEYLI